MVFLLILFFDFLFMIMNINLWEDLVNISKVNVKFKVNLSEYGEIEVYFCVWFNCYM